MQGDTLLHVACRKANRKLVEILLAAGSPEECRNFKMKKPIEVAGDPKIRQELDDLTLVHRIGGVKMKNKGLALDLVRVGRQLFPAWCYNNSWEGGVLLRAISGIKAGVKSFGTMLRVLMAEGKHCQWRATQYGMREARKILRRELEGALARARATELARLRRLAEDEEAAARQGRDKDDKEKEVSGRQAARSVGAMLRKDKARQKCCGTRNPLFQIGRACIGTAATAPEPHSC